MLAWILVTTAFILPHPIVVLTRVLLVFTKVFTQSAIEHASIERKGGFVNATST